MPNKALGGGVGASAGLPPQVIGQADYDAFERLLGEIQAPTAEDVGALGAMATPVGKRERKA